MELLQRGDRLLTQCAQGLAMHEPVAVDGHDPATPCRVSSRPRSRSGPKGTRPDSGATRYAAAAGVADVFLDDRLRTVLAQQREVRDECRRLALEPGGRNVEQGTATDRHHRRVGADDEPIARQRDERSLEAEAHQRRVAGLELLAIEQEHAGHDLAGAVCTRTRSRVLSGRGASASSSSVPSTSSDGTRVPGRPTTLPRSTARRSTPCRLTAVRWPALDCSTA
jgi:hypothetical protein